MDGLELIRFLKEKEYPGEILVLSNYEDFDSVRSALLLGAADYLLKIKIQPDTLLACLNKTTKKMQNTADRKDSILKTFMIIRLYGKRHERRFNPESGGYFPATCST